MSAESRCARSVKAWGAALVTGALLWACATLPAYGPPVDSQPGRPVRIEAGKGRLSAAQSAAILDKLERSGEGGDLLQRHIAIEEAVTGSPLVAGNKVTLLEDGPATYKAMFAAIRAAKDHINLEVYIFRDDDVGREFAELLVAKQTQGVQVNLMYDGVGSIKTPRAFFAAMADRGVRVLEFNPVKSPTTKSVALNHRDHRKLLVVDGRVAFVGGINIDDVYSSSSAAVLRKSPADEKESGWRDMHVRIEGPVVAEFQKLFLEHWQSQQGEPPPPREYLPEVKPAGDALVRALGATADEPYSLVYQTLLSAVAHSQKTVHVTVAYFIPDQQTVEVLRDAARRGVDVALILPGETDFWAVFHAGRSHYSDLLDAGVKIYERHGALLHSKTAVIDGVWSSIGSTNWDPRSFIHNDELNAEVLGRDFAAKMEEAFEKDLRQSARIRADEWKDRSLALRFKEWSARLWEYWL
jgi:cardiolipin synthase